MIKVAVIDDQEMVRAGIKMILESDPEIAVVAEGDSGVAAVAVATAHDVDVMLMDIRMAGGDGITAAQHITQAHPAIQILMLTTFNEDELVFQSLQAGASGFLLKNVDGDSLIAAVKVLAAGESLLDPAVTGKVIAQFCDHRTEPVLRPVPPEVTNREVEVWRLLASGLSNQEISQVLFVSSSTVKSHVSNLLQKIGARDRVQAVIAAYEYGIVRA